MSTVAGSGWAADDPEAAAAKRHYEEGTKAFNLGEYPRAITEFKATYNAKPDPLLLYNIAQSYRLQGDASQALFFYKSFLRNMPGASNRKEVEGRIKALDKQLAEQKKEPPTPPIPVTPPSAGTAPESQTAPGNVIVAPPPAATTSTPPASLGQAAAQSAGSSQEGGAAPKGSAAGQSPPKAATGATPTTPQGLSQTDQGAPAPQVDLTTPAAPHEEPARPIYKKWWFWAGSAVAILVIGGGIAAAGANKAPSTQLGLFVPTFK